jgi:hypothetical protein
VKLQGAEGSSNPGFPPCPLSELPFFVLTLVLCNPSPPKGRELGHRKKAPPTTDLGLTQRGYPWELGKSAGSSASLPARREARAQLFSERGQSPSPGGGFKPVKTYTGVHGVRVRTVCPHLSRVLGPRRSSRANQSTL